MKVGVSVRWVPYGNGYEGPKERNAAVQAMLDGRLGDWLRMHNLYRDIDVHEMSLWITFSCNESQYMELLLGFEGEYFIEIIEK